MNLMKKQFMVVCLAVSLFVSGINNFSLSCAQATEEVESIYKDNDYSVSLKIDSAWDNNYSATVTIENTGNTDIIDWKLEFESKDKINNIWNAEMESANNKHIISNLDWNKTIKQGDSISFGFIASYNEYKDISETFKLISGIAEVSSKNKQAKFEIESSWDGGSIVNVTIENNSDFKMRNWEISFDAEYEIDTIWNAVIISNEDGKYHIKNADYNANIESFGQVSFGYKIKGQYCSEKNITLMETKVQEEKNNTDIIGEIQLSNSIILTDEKYKLRVFAEIQDRDICSNCSVRLYRYINGKWSFCDYLYDSGELDAQGDEIKNDGIYSNFLSLCEKEAGKIEYKVVVTSDDKELDSQCVTLKVISKLEEDSLEQYYRSNEIIKEYIDERIKNISGDIVPSEIIEEIKGLSGVGKIKEIVFVDDWTVKILFDNGLLTYVQIADDSDKELMRRGGQAEEDDGDTIIADSDSYFGEADIEDENVKEDGYDYGEPVDKQYQTYDYVLSNDILLWNPFDTEWGESDETELISSIADNSSYELKLDVVKDAEADIASLKKLPNYGLIILASHGIEGKWLATGEACTDTMQYSDELQTGKLSVLIRGETSAKKSQMLYMVHASWIENNIDGSFPNSIILNNSCSSLKRDEFWNAFEKKGAKTYYGYSGSVTNDYVVVQTENILSNLIDNGASTQEAFEYSYDCQYGGEYFGIRGYGNILLPIGLMNGGFEKGLSGWKKEGDGRYLSRLGNILPTEGNHMAIISTGLGYTKELGEISQRFFVPKDAKKLSFDWNFLSEEFLEYIGSSYKDPFEVSLVLKDGDNKKHTLLHVDVNSIAEDFGATTRKAGNLTSVSPQISFDQGDVWMTGWQKSEVDISEYSGECVTLIFTVKDAVDTVYTTAILIDNLSFDVGNIVPGSALKVSENYNDETIRGLFRKKNKKGRSYVFYKPDLNEKKAFTKQAKKERKRIKYKYGYSKLRQVEMSVVLNEKQFVSQWKKMDDSKKIDKVSLLFHGTFYAVIIDDDKKQNLVTNPEGKVGSDEHATYIRDLEKKNIGMISLFTCNGGLLDSINYDNDITSKKKTFQIKGNVAQAFLDSQNVDKVEAWDGSMGYWKVTYRPRLAFDQTHFRDKLEMVKNKRVIKPIRGRIVYSVSEGKTTNINPQKPHGKITYTRNSNGSLSCKYSYIRETRYYSGRIEMDTETDTIEIKDLS